ncbi:hypothetical protein [Streptomyces liangshanensis]|uniref:Uncharacterized protein n=1 Tax=Streptomyces liangshanensis TaxID=2717324 RepID=A0A6G9H6J2_9ACTN|nr:hypothetical protein [Streptomyces liangshanensis]QIQ06153.1 hypothetical protein HA039_30995 [Streptomyces liangshanensis]
MGDHSAEPAPGLWEYALAAADELVLWHLGTAAARQDRVEEVQAHHAPVVVLLAAALHDRALAADLAGTDLDRVELAAAYQVLEAHAVPAVEAAPAAPGLGGEQRAQLLAERETPAFEVVRTAALRVLAGHLADGGPLLADRAGALAAEGRARRLRQLEHRGPTGGI